MAAGYFASCVGEKGAQPVDCLEWKKERLEGGIERSEGGWSLLLDGQRTGKRRKLSGGVLVRLRAGEDWRFDHNGEPGDNTTTPREQGTGW
jgi:hypothetical protein